MGTFATSILTFCLGSFNFWVSGAFLHFLGSLLPLENLLWTPMLQVFFIISFEVAKIIKLVGKHYQDISGESYYQQPCLKMYSRAPWSCGLMHHVLDREVEGLNLVVNLLAMEKRKGKDANGKNEACRLKTERSEMRRNLDSKIAVILLHCQYSVGCAQAQIIFYFISKPPNNSNNEKEKNQDFV